MKKQTNINKLCGVVMTLAGVVFGGTTLITSGVVSAADTDSWGPQDRATYTWNSPASAAVFNSMTDNPEIGDERNFVRIREAGTDDVFTDSVDLKVGKTYEVYVFYHNNASATLNASGTGIAQNVRVAMEMPEKISNDTTGIVKGTITSTNTIVPAVWDTAYMKSDQTVYLRYVPDSAVIHNSVVSMTAADGTVHPTANGTVLSADALFSEDGARLATWIGEGDWGLIPGCNEYAGYITYSFVVDQPLFYIENEVSHVGENNWVSDIEAKPGEILDFRTHYKNWGTTAQNSVNVCEQLGVGLTAVNGSVRIATSYTSEVAIANDEMFDPNLCMIVGNFAPDEEFDVTYQMKVSDSEEIFPCGKTVTYNNVVVKTANGDETDRVRITVNRSCDGEPTIIPETGPAQIALAVVVVIAIIGGGFYLYDSQRKLNNTAKRAGVNSGRAATARRTTAKKSTAAKKAVNSKSTTRTAARTNNTAKKMTAVKKSGSKKK